MGGKLFLVTRFLSAKPDSRLLPLPWSTPLAQWPQERLVALPRGISRHVVRFITVDDDVYAAKEDGRNRGITQKQFNNQALNNNISPSQIK